MFQQYITFILYTKQIYIFYYYNHSYLRWILNFMRYTHTYLHDLQYAFHRITIHKFWYVTSGITRILYLGYFSITRLFTHLFCFSVTFILEKFIESIQISLHFFEMHYIWHFLSSNLCLLYSFDNNILKFLTFLLEIHVSLRMYFSCMPRNFKKRICILLYEQVRII